MNKRELAKSVAVHSDVSLKTVTAVLDAFTDVVTAVVSQGEPVAISGFAKFVKVNRPARMGRNPATGEAIKIKASKKARITPVKAFKEAVMNPSIAPKLKKGVYPADETAVRRAGAPVKVAKAAAPARKARKAAAKRKPVRAAAGRRTTAKKAGTRRKVTARAATTRRRTTTARATTARRVTKKTTARKTTARRAAPKKATRRPAAKKRSTSRR